jgi:hypothetical protein
MSIDMIHDRKVLKTLRRLSFGYFALAAMFIGMFLISAQYGDIRSLVTALKDPPFRNLSVYASLNIILSLAIGITLVFKKVISRRLIILIISFAAAVVLLDIPPILKEVLNYIKHSKANIPFTTIIFIIHGWLLCLVYLQSKKLKLI